ncbi:helix-turn-helix domain-containing protein [Pseudomonas aeruginosa]
MSYEKVLGEVLRDIRLRAGIPYEGLAGIISERNLRAIEIGHSISKLTTLIDLCEAFGITPSQVLMAVEARQSGRGVEEQIAVSNKRLMELLHAGRLEPVAADDAVRGVRGQKADATRSAVIALQAEGLSKDEIARKLGVVLRTVQRYWVKDE